MSTLVAGKYEVLGRLAMGGMAEVFLARLKGPGDFERRLVIKRVLPGLATEAEFTRLFEQEARFAALIEHPNVAQVFDFGHDAEGRAWLAMEYVDGASLRALLRAAAERHERPDPRLVAHVFARVAEGLAAAHDLVDPRTREPLQLVHRDVSPDNVLVSRLGAVKVSDFGIARAMVQAGTTRPDQLRGKLRYLAPEQLRGEQPTPAVDVWAIGVCLFEALAGRRPFPEENEGQTVTAIITGQRPSLASLRPDCPGALVEIVDACLAVDVARRMPDCHELALSLERAVAANGPPITTAMLGAWVERLIPAGEEAQQARWVPALGTPGGDEAREAAWRPTPGPPHSADARASVTPAPTTPPAPDDFVPTSALSARMAALEPTPGNGTGRPEPASPSVQPVDGRPEDPPPRAAERTASTPAPPATPGPGRWLRPILGVTPLGLLGLGLWRWRVTHPPEPEPARVVVTSKPSGATVHVNGVVMGTTPWGGDIRAVAPFVVEVSAPGYVPFKQTLPPGVAASVFATLQRKR